MTNLFQQCCICKGSMPIEGEQEHQLDPCALVIVAHTDKPWREQKEQTFFCHFECFRKLVGDDGLMYIAQPDFGNNGDVEDEGAD